MKIPSFSLKNRALWLWLVTTCLALPLQAGESRAWGPEQATGTPNSQGPGDLESAWASLTEDSRDEWLLLEYLNAVEPAQLRVFETFNPGAVARITALDEDDKESLLWEGTDPLRNGPPAGVAEFSLNSAAASQRIKLYLNSREIAGWNEIDAVELVAKDGSRQWAHLARASSTYAEPTPLATTTRAADEFSPYLNQPVVALMEDGSKVHGMLLSSGKGFLILRTGRNQQVVMLNISKILTLEIVAGDKGIDAAIQ